MKKHLLTFSLLFASCTMSSIGQALELDWGITYGGTDTDYTYGIAVDNDGAVYTTGYFYGTVDFDPTSGVHELSAAGTRDAFITKSNADGTLAWVKQFGSGGDDSGYDLAVDADGNVYGAGYFSNTVDFDPGTNQTSITSQGLSDSYIIKLNAAGELVWVKTWGDQYYQASRDLAIDESRNVYIIGHFQGTVDFDPSSSSTFELTAGFFDAFVLKLNTDGSFAWATKFGSSNTSNFDGAYQIALDHDDNLIVGGTFKGTVDFDPSPTATANVIAANTSKYFAKLTTAGEFVWVKTIMLNAESDQTASIAVDTDNNVYLTGSFIGNTDLDPSANTAAVTSTSGSIDVFVVKLSESGNYIWSHTYGGSLTDYAASIAIDDNNQVLYLSGAYSSTVDFDSNPVATALYTSNGATDAYLLCLDLNGQYQWLNSTGGANNDGSYSLAVKNASPYVSGFFSSSLDLNPGSPVQTVTSLGDVDFFIQKYQPLSTSIEQGQTEVLAMEVFPNPTNGWVTVKTNQELVDATLQVIAPTGTVLLKLTHQCGNQFNLDLSAQSKGVYTIEISEKSYKKQIKIIIN